MAAGQGLTLDLTGKVALVTGTGPNIGRELARTLAAAGATVLCNDVNPDHARQTAAFLQEQGLQAAPAPADVADPEQVSQMVHRAEREYGGIDILVNNAAITVRQGLLEVSYEDWKRCLHVILDGVFLTSQAVARSMVRQGRRGSITHIASASGHRGRSNAIAYATAKAGVLNMTRSMAVELAPHGIRVNSVSPLKIGIPVGRSPGASRSFVEVPLGRLGMPPDVAGVVVFLASEAAAFISGVDIPVDGGALAAHPEETVRRATQMVQGAPARAASQ